MLKQADSNDVQVDIQLDIFDKVSKWVSISNKLEDQVFWYKAAPHNDFRICSPEFWSHSAAYAKDDEEKDDDFDPTAGGRSRRFQLNVHRA